MFTEPLHRMSLVLMLMLIFPHVRSFQLSRSAADKLNKRYLEAGVVVRMFEKTKVTSLSDNVSDPDWLRQEVEFMLQHQPSSVLRPDLPLAMFSDGIKGFQIGFVFKPIPVEQQLSGSPVDEWKTHSGLRQKCSSPKSAFVEDWWSTWGSWANGSDFNRENNSGLCEVDTWEEAFAYQRELSQSQAAHWNSGLKSFFSPLCECCYNQVNMLPSRVDQVEAVFYRKDCAMGLAQSFAHHIQTQYGVNIPAVQLNLPSRECSDPRETQRRIHDAPGVRIFADTQSVEITTLSDLRDFWTALKKLSDKSQMSSWCLTCGTSNGPYKVFTYDNWTQSVESRRRSEAAIADLIGPELPA